MRRIRLASQLAEPISHYTDGVEAGGFLYVSGMLPLDVNGDVVGTGSSSEEVRYETRRDSAGSGARTPVRRRLQFLRRQ
jgi:enamine deaminase RidA (YjgF/YER057c/UK114 family)